MKPKIKQNELNPKVRFEFHTNFFYCLFGEQYLETIDHAIIVEIEKFVRIVDDIVTGRKDEFPMVGGTII